MIGTEPIKITMRTWVRGYMGVYGVRLDLFSAHKLLSTKMIYTHVLNRSPKLFKAQPISCDDRLKMLG